MTALVPVPRRVDVARRAPDGSCLTVVSARLAGDRVLLAGSPADIAIVIADAAERAASRIEDGPAFLLALPIVYPLSVAGAYGAWVAIPSCP